MRMSLARRHRTHALAMAAAVVASTAEGERMPPGPEATEYEIMRAQLGLDLAKLREIQSLEAKIELKRELIPNYVPWIKGVLEAGKGDDGVGGQDDIVVQLMIWVIDVGEYDDGLVLAEHVLRFGLELPQRFNRTAGCLVAEEIADAALAALAQQQPFDLDVLLKAEELTAEQDMPDQVRAKLAKAIGLILAERAERLEPGADGPAAGKRAALEGAIARLRRALQLDPRAGVKKLLERLDREVKKIPETAGGQA